MHCTYRIFKVCRVCKCAVPSKHLAETQLCSTGPDDNEPLHIIMFSASEIVCECDRRIQDWQRLSLMEVGPHERPPAPTPEDAVSRGDITPMDLNWAYMQQRRLVDETKALIQREQDLSKRAKVHASATVAPGAPIIRQMEFAAQTPSYIFNDINAVPHGHLSFRNRLREMPHTGVEAALQLARKDDEDSRSAELAVIEEYVDSQEQTTAVAPPSPSTTPNDDLENTELSNGEQMNEEESDALGIIHDGPSLVYEQTYSHKPNISTNF